jgi:hypothetical protein
MRTLESGSSTNLTASGQVGPVGASVQLLGFYVNSTSSGTIIFKAVNSTGTALGGTITPAIGWNRYPADCPTGLYATIGGTLDVTFIYDLNS